MGQRVGGGETGPPAQYQVPSDLLTACSEGEPVPGAEEAVRRVKGHVKAMKDMIGASRKRELEEEAQRAVKRMLEEDRRTPELQLQCAPMVAPMELAQACEYSKGRVPSSLRARKACPRKAPASAAPGRGGGGMAPLPPPAAAPAPSPPADSSPHSPTPQASGEAQPPVHVPLEATPTEGLVAESGTAGPVADYTRLPALLDERFEALDVDSALRPTIITPGAIWEKRSQAGLLSDMKQTEVGVEEQKALRQQAMDLIDALSRSGTLAMADAQLHVVLAATHCFDQSLLDTVVQRNVNPVERVERSALIMAAAIHDRPPAALLKAAQEARIKGHSALLFR